MQSSKSKWVLGIQIFIVSISILSIVIAGLYSYQDSKLREIDGRKKAADDLRLKLNQEKVALNNLSSILELKKERLMEFETESTSNLGGLKLKLSELEKDLEDVKSQTLGLRQAIKRENPEDMITIARLADRVDGLIEKMERFEERMHSEQKSFRDSLQREVEASNNATNLIIVALIPLVINLIYNIWKDNRVVRIAEDENPQKKALLTASDSKIPEIIDIEPVIGVEKHRKEELKGTDSA